MDIIIIILGIFLIIWEESNKKVLTPKQQQTLLKMKPLVDEQKRLQDDLISGKIFKK